VSFDPRAHLAGFGLPSEAAAVRLTGGYTNEVWRVGELVVKRYDRTARPLLLGNDPLAEARALAVLAGRRVAPEPVHFDEVKGVVVYRFAEGRTWDGGTGRVARLLGEVHTTPGHGFRTLPIDGGAILADGRRFLQVERGREVARRRPEAVRCGPVGRRLVHRDAGPGNLIESADRLVLIDWQAPGAGDPVEDLAAFLSPAFQILYGREPLTDDDEGEFLDAYPAPLVVRRLQRMRACYDWRMSAYCAWRAEQLDGGDPAASATYTRATDALLERL
jgi:aminoglycoside phosphotransferase (APT) family kinase protein